MRGSRGGRAGRAAAWASSSLHPSNECCAWILTRRKCPASRPSPTYGSYLQVKRAAATGPNLNLDARARTHVLSCVPPAQCPAFPAVVWLSLAWWFGLAQRTGRPPDLLRPHRRSRPAQVENLLKLQLPESDAAGTPAHDELLFIIIHQTYELWFKQVLHEINWLRETFAAAVIDEAVMLKVVRILQRVVEILKICAAQIQILHTMTPAGFLEFRNLLGTSSGFQSVQFRLLEIRLGLKRGSRIRYRSKDYNEELTAEEAAVVLKAESEDSLHDLIETWLERTPGLESGWWEGFQANVEGDNAAARAEAEAIADPRDREDALKTCTSNEETFKTIFDSESHAELMEEGSRSLSFEASKAALMISLLREKPRFHLPDKMLQLLQDVDTQLLGWRHNHVGVVQRTIGAKPGTGGGSACGASRPGRSPLARPLLRARGAAPGPQR